MRRLLHLFLALVLAGAALWLWGYRNARADPVVRRATIALSGWPAGAAPVRVALLSDIHIGDAATDPKRLARIVGQVNALAPDLVLLAGDFVAGDTPGQARFAAQLVAPLAALKAPLGVVAVLGNHDHWVGAGAVRAALETARITVLDNAAVARGPLAIAGVGDVYTGHDSLAQALGARARLRGVPLLLTHSPDLAPRVPAGLVLAGHMHCGQAVLPLIGPVTLPSRLGRRYMCGMAREGARTVIVTGGIGTSMVPLRYGAPPDLWLLTLGPA